MAENKYGDIYNLIESDPRPSWKDSPFWVPGVVWKQETPNVSYESKREPVQLELNLNMKEDNGYNTN